MDTSKIGIGEMIAGVSALALFIFMFLPWYGIDAVGGIGLSGVDVSAWEAFSFVDILLFLAAAVVIALVLAQAAGATPELPQPAGLIIAAAGGLALLLVLFRLIFTPDADTGGFDVDVDLGREIGIFLGLIATAGMAYGGWRAMSEPAAAGSRRGDGHAVPPVGTQTTSAPSSTAAEPSPSSAPAAGDVTHPGPPPPAGDSSAPGGAPTPPAGGSAPPGGTTPGSTPPAGGTQPPSEGQPPAGSPTPPRQP